MNTQRIRACIAIGAACAIGAAMAADLPRSPAPKDAELYFISPQDGATVKSPVTVRFGLSGMGVAPAGVAIENTGHHHLLIDAELPPQNLPVPADANHVHFGKGQTEASVTLAPGRHRLQLLLGDHLHIPHDPPVASKPITITVE
ncbi:MAG TPA: DUF4399 domain-containing protein [Steroidobacteraceae bacterium]|nr:DUF4399 domain-containing protein [Steroidobacteraceae bacterium]